MTVFHKHDHIYAITQPRPVNPQQVLINKLESELERLLYSGHPNKETKLEEAKTKFRADYTRKFPEEASEVDNIINNALARAAQSKVKSF